MEKIIELRRFSSAMDAEMAKGILQGAGIQCEINDFIFDTLYPMEAIKRNNIRLLVNESDAKLADEILNAKFVQEE